MAPQSDTDQDSEEQQACREAEIATASDGGPLGACIYLTPTDLEELGIDPSKTNCLSYIVEEGHLKVRKSEER